MRYLADDFSLLLNARMARYVLYRGILHTLH